MAEPTQFVFDYTEIVEALIKKQGLHEGVWGIFVEFGIQGANADLGAGQSLPVAIVPVQKLGIQRVSAGNKVAGMVDAAVVNPPSRATIATK